MNREKRLIKISRIVGLLMFLIVVIVAYLLSSLFSWDLNFSNWNLLSVFVMIAGVIYAFLGLRYNSKETKMELDNVRSIDGKMKPLYEEIRNKTKVASIEQKYAIIQQCAKMKDYAKSVNDNYVYRVSQRLEYVMSEALGINVYQAKDFFSKRKSGSDMEILSTIRNNVVLRDFLVYYFNLYSSVSAGTIDFDGGESSFYKIADLCSSIENSFGLTHTEARNIIETHKDR